ncbi:MAG: hypothetical protein WKF91_15875 [Segetibacter sp.]
MAEQKIELRKIRDLSENLNDTFGFIRQNFKPLVTSFLIIAGIFMLANSILNGIYQGGVMGGAFKDFMRGYEDGVRGNRNTTRSPFWMFNETYFVVVVLAWINFIAMSAVITCYMKLYDRLQKQAPTIQEVWDEFKKYFLKVLLYSVPIALLTAAGFAFCLIPGIYLAVVFVPFSIAVIVEDETFGGAWNRCFALIKDNFWNSFGTYLLVYIIYSFSAGIISGVFALLTGLASYFTTKDISTTIGIATSVLNIFSFVFYIVFYVSVVLHYFNLAERQYGTGVLQRLNTLGEKGNDFNNVQEQY